MPGRSPWLRRAALAALISIPTAPVVAAELSPTPQPVAGQEWTNSLGMKFVPAGTPGVLFCVWDVRVKDFEACARAMNYRQTGGLYMLKIKPAADGSFSQVWERDFNASWDNPGFAQDPNHPVVGISWFETAGFCRWLTKKERGEGRLGSDQMYRLPTDAEWTAAAGNGTYPWGETWPPPAGAGNYGDQSFAASLPGTGWTVLPENDGYPRTSPVGSFGPNAYGLYDMGGNVWQWCMDWYQASMNSAEARQKNPALNADGGGQRFKVLRGGSWSNSDAQNLSTLGRNTIGPNSRGTNGGFRLVVVVSH